MKILCLIFLTFVIEIFSQNEDCPGPHREEPFAVSMESICSVMCSRSQQCSSYIFTPSYLDQDGICQILDKFNDNILAEDIGMAAGSIMRLGIFWNNELYFVYI